ncbi:MAG: M48 family metallopeptidase [Candidatus Parcubacteria bacterium]|nr:M48 family metallopeptidase [Candidatus Parcubacteria bacterium]
MTLYSQSALNIRRTWLLLFVFLLVIIALGWFLSWYFNKPNLLIFAVVFSFIWSFFSYWQSDKIILAISKAREIKKQDAPELYRLVENLCITAGLPLPKIYIMDEPSPNAFATGRDPKHAVICVTSGLLATLEKSELEGVIAHELCHIGNRDILIASLVVVLVGIVSIVSDWLIRSMIFSGGDRDRENSNPLGIIIMILVLIISPVVALLIQLAVSRKREFLADSSGALLTRYPEGLAKALEKISQDKRPIKSMSNTTRSLYFSDPVKKNKESWFAKLWLTHPPTSERIKLLREMSI